MIATRTVREAGPPTTRDLHDRLEGIEVPVSLIRGRHDRAIQLPIAESASERYGWPLHVIEDTADDAPFERPGAFLEALRQAMDETVFDTREAAGTKGGI